MILPASTHLDSNSRRLPHIIIIFIGASQLDVQGRVMHDMVVALAASYSETGTRIMVKAIVCGHKPVSH